MTDRTDDLTWALKVARRRRVRPHKAGQRVSTPTRRALAAKGVRLAWWTPGGYCIAAALAGVRGLP